MKKIITLTLIFCTSALVNLATVQSESSVMVKCIPNCAFLVQQNNSQLQITTYDANGNRISEQIDLNTVDPQGKLVMDHENLLAPALLVLRNHP